MSIVSYEDAALGKGLPAFLPLAEASHGTNTTFRDEFNQLKDPYRSTTVQDFDAIMDEGHWRFLLTLSNGAGIAYIDMGAFNGLLWNGFDADRPKADRQKISFHKQREFTARDIDHFLVQEKKRQRYEYHYDDYGQPFGCRLWCIVAVYELEKAGFLQPGSIQHFQTELQKLAAAGKIKMPTVPGKFFAEQ